MLEKQYFTMDALPPPCVSDVVMVVALALLFIMFRMHSNGN